MELVAMTCRNCGGTLKFSSDADQVLCQHCGGEYLVSFAEGAVSLQVLAEGVQRIRESSEKASAELALSRLRKDLEDVTRDAWNLYAQQFFVGKQRSIRLEDEMPQLSQPHGAGTLEPDVALIYLSTGLKQEEARFFRDKERIARLAQATEEASDLVARYEELKRQAEHYRRLLAE